jgi:hypothetical protein
MALENRGGHERCDMLAKIIAPGMTEQPVPGAGGAVLP